MRRMMTKTPAILWTVATLFGAATLGGCDDEPEPQGPDATADTVLAETAGEVSAETTEEVGAETVEDVGIETVEDAAPEVAQDVPSEVAEEVGAETTEDVTPDEGEETVSDIPSTDDGNETVDDVPTTDDGEADSMDEVADAGPADGTDATDAEVDTTPPVELPPQPWAECENYCAGLDAFAPNCSFTEVSKAGCDLACTMVGQPGLAPSESCIGSMSDLVSCMEETDPGFQCDEELGAAGPAGCGEEFWTSLGCFRDGDVCLEHCSGIMAAGCSAGPTDLASCQARCFNGATLLCSLAWSTVSACVGPGTVAPTYTCDGQGLPVAQGCETYSDAVNSCVLWN